MDYYLEFVFPEMNVRYIAVNDNEDTDKGLSDFVPFKNLFNEFFAKDTSRKVKIALHAKFVAGERTFTTAPLGYMRHPENRNKLAIDREFRPRKADECFLLRTKRAFVASKVSGFALKIHTKQLSQKMFSIKSRNRLQVAVDQ